jgi:hypothetical protein
MKKFLLALLAIVFAIPFANATDTVLHLEGTKHGWSSGSNLTFNHVEGTSIYTLDNVTLYEGEEFLICGPNYSPKYANGESNIAFGSNTLYNWENEGGNMKPSYALYDVNLIVDNSSSEPKLTIVKNVYLRGDWKGWDTCDDTTKFSTEDGKTYTLFVEELPTNFLIASSDWNNNNNCKFGGVEIKSSDDLNVAKSLSYKDYGGDITLYQTLKNVTITFKWTPNSKDGATVTLTVPYEYVYLYGNFNDTDNWVNNSAEYRYKLSPNGDYTSFSAPMVITAGKDVSDAYFRLHGVYDTTDIPFLLTSDTSIEVESGKAYDFNKSGNEKSYKVAPGVYTVTVSLAAGATSGTITFTKKNVTEMYIYGEVLNENNELCNTIDKKIALSQAKDANAGTNVAIDGSFEGTFTFAKSARTSAMRRSDSDDNCSFYLVDGDGTVYGSANGETEITVAGNNADMKNYAPVTLYAGEDVQPLQIVAGEQKIVVNTVTGASYASDKDVATGVADVEVSEDALVNVYNYSGVMIRKGVKASEATVDLPKGLYIVGNQKLIVK